MNGRPLDAKKTYTLVTTSFVAGGGDQYAMFKGRPSVPLKEKLTDSGVLRKAIEDAKTIAPRTDGRIKRLDTPAESRPCAAPTPTPMPTPAAAAAPAIMSVPPAVAGGSVSRC